MAVLTSSSFPSTLALYGSEMSSSDTSFSLLRARLGLEKLGTFTGDCFSSSRSFRIEEADVARIISDGRILAL